MSISGGAALHKLQKPEQTPFLLLRFSCQSSILGLRPMSPFGAANVGNSSQKPGQTPFLLLRFSVGAQFWVSDQRHHSEPPT
ncbi:TIR-NBS-LRR type disease resistance protein [Arachis hypogaea]|nr:TIR-NBS-LRR type disease resistance protein [Arachis hypogaea]